MLLVRLTAFTLLAAVCCTLPAAATRVVTCDNGENVQFLICDSGVISIERALYGRTDGTTCREGRPANQLTNTQCSQIGTLEVLSQRCNGKQVCEVNTEVFRTSDPCVGIYKYLDTTYTCIPATRSITCEGSDGLLECDEGTIQIHSANYGRRDQLVCSFNRPANQLANTNCLSQSITTSKVAKRCNGKSQCDVTASNSLYGDPCVGTYKYLDVAYTCVGVFVQVTICNILLVTTTTEPATTTPVPSIMLLVRLTAFTLLAAVCCTLPAAATRVVTCDNGENVQFLICDSGVISIERALYGRTDGTTCREGRPANQLTNTQCSQIGTLEVLSQRCNGKQVCEVNTEVFRTSDPCVGIYKYLDTTYTCIPATRSITCEGSDGLLECDEGTIQIHSANYGRRDQLVCSFNRPANQLANTNCLSQSITTSKVAKRCNGKSQCDVTASNSLYGDPCVGTYKYLDVAYTCG
ncbi:rhamnose-binding lectin-like [Oncorhynchus masou masou]|uniref:rhamnose-binding lectin-like n=1 Tax=Oncorhynchus masou masou TaxID=90313 RepID=UPI0031838586